MLSEVETVLHQDYIYLDFDVPMFRKWVKAILDVNRLHSIVYLFDEFHPFIEANSSQLKTFEDVTETPGINRFFLVPVTHMDIQQYWAEGSESAKKANDRFYFRKLQMPNDTAFRLARHAMIDNPNPDIAAEWEKAKGDLWDSISYAVLNVCLSIERLGIPVRRLPVNQEGIVESEAFQTSISDQTKLVSVMLANNEIGTVEPISALAEIAHQHGALFHTDAVQAVGHIPVDVKALGVDLLSASGHKFNGPKGVGFLYIKKGTEIQPYANGGGQESGIRAGTENIASIVAMACALRKNCDRMITVSERLSRMEHIFIHTLNQAGIDYIRNGADNHIPGNINISIRDANGESLLHRLDLKGICISTGSACDSVNIKVSHVIQAIGIPKEYAQGTIRISFGADNIETDASEVATALIEILRK